MKLLPAWPPEAIAVEFTPPDPLDIAALLAAAVPASPALDPIEYPLPPALALADDDTAPEPVVSAVLLALALPPAPPG